MRKIVRDRILAKYGHKCAHCGSTENLEVDHIIPLSKGGKHNEENFQILCKSCNLKKGRGFDFTKFFRIGISPEYIEIHQSWLDVHNSMSAKESQQIIHHMYYENDKIFGLNVDSE